MSEVHEEALISWEGPPSSVNSTVAQRSGRTATKLDSLLVLAAVLAYTFGWGPMLEVPGVGAVIIVGVVIIVAVSLLWLLFEQVVPLKGRWVASDGWLRMFTKGDMLILLLAILNGPFLHIPLLVAVVIWGLVSGIAWRRGQRAGADDWFHRAAIFASFVALMIGEEASKVWLYSGAVGTSPSPLTHAGFHQFLDGAIGVSCTLLLLLLGRCRVVGERVSCCRSRCLGGCPCRAQSARLWGLAHLRLAPHHILGVQRALCHSRSGPSATSSFHEGWLKISSAGGSHKSSDGAPSSYGLPSSHPVCMRITCIRSPLSCRASYILMIFDPFAYLIRSYDALLRSRQVN